jgi:hypothetical protein
MTLKAEAQKLCLALEAITKGLEAYDKDDHKIYTKSLAFNLRPRTLSFRQAIDENKSREQAKEVLDEMMKLMYEINSAATKGGIDFVAHDVLSIYWELKTIFQESRFRDEEL